MIYGFQLWWNNKVHFNKTFKFLVKKYLTKNKGNISGSNKSCLMNRRPGEVKEQNVFIFSSLFLHYIHRYKLTVQLQLF